MSALNEQQRMMVASARRQVHARVVEPRLDQALDRAAEFPHAVLRDLWEQGLLNLELPEDVGGAGLSCHDHALVPAAIW